MRKIKSQKISRVKSLDKGLFINTNTHSLLLIKEDHLGNPKLN